MTYSLWRARDHAGDSGGMSLLLWTEDAKILTENNGRPRVGVAIRVGSLYARSYTHQDWWQTTIITEILQDEEKTVKFKTGSSIYTWSC